MKATFWLWVAAGFSITHAMADPAGVLQADTSTAAVSETVTTLGPTLAGTSSSAVAAGFQPQLCPSADALPALKWLSDLEEGKKAAAAQKKQLLVLFTGAKDEKTGQSWCKYCRFLEDGILSKPDFKSIQNTFVLVKLPYPGIGAPPDALQKVKDLYAVDGFPTILLMDEKGRPYWTQSGMEEDDLSPALGPEAPGAPGARFAKKLNTAIQIRTQRDDLFSQAQNAEGAAKLRLLDQAMTGVHDQGRIEDFGGYETEVGQIIGLGSSDPKIRYRYIQMPEVRKEVRAGDLSGAEKALEPALNEKDLDDAQKQYAWFVKGQLRLQQSDQEGAVAAIRKAIDIAPQSVMAQQIRAAIAQSK